MCLSLLDHTIGNQEIHAPHSLNPNSRFPSISFFVSNASTMLYRGKTTLVLLKNKLKLQLLKINI